MRSTVAADADEWNSREAAASPVTQGTADAQEASIENPTPLMNKNDGTYKHATDGDSSDDE